MKEERARVVAAGLVLACLAGNGAAQDDGAVVAEERGLLRRAEGAFGGYTLISPLLSRTTYLLDMDGEVVHEWRNEYAPAGGFYLLESGNLLRGGRLEESPTFNGGGIGGRIQEIDWEGEVVWDYLLADEDRWQHHDLEPLPNGNVLAIVWEHRFEEDAVAWGRDPLEVSGEGIWPDAVLEIRPIRPDGGEIVWEWHAWDHLIQDRDPELPNHGSIPDRPGRIDIAADHRDRAAMTEEERLAEEELLAEMRALGYGGEEEEADDGGGGRRGSAPDWLHTNAVDYNAEYDLIVLSTPQLNELWVIDHSTTTEEAAWGDGGRWGRGGDLLWRWGNPRNYGAGDDADRRLFYQHDPQWIPGEKPGELRLLVYNNGGGRPDGDYSSVEELVLPFDPEKGFQREKGRPFGPAEPAWSYADRGEFFSAFISGAQRLPNGNTLICEGAEGRVFEVTRGGEVVWEYLNPHGGEVPAPAHAGQAPPKALFRATRIAPDHPGLAGREL